MSDIVKTILDGGLETSGMILLCVLAYKIYKMKITSESDCCSGCLKLKTENEGGADSHLTSAV